MLGVFAEFETNLRRERQLEGIAKAKAEGVYKGREATIDVARVQTLRGAGKGPAANCEGTEDGMVVRLSRAGGVRRERLKSGP